MLEVVLGDVVGNYIESGVRRYWRWCYEILEVVLGDVVGNYIGSGARRYWRRC